jgi:hypothetical protein
MYGDRMPERITLETYEDVFSKLVSIFEKIYSKKSEHRAENFRSIRFSDIKTGYVFDITITTDSVVREDFRNIIVNVKKYIEDVENVQIYTGKLDIYVSTLGGSLLTHKYFVGISRHGTFGGAPDSIEINYYFDTYKHLQISMHA